jgi:hypothetical protein
LNLPDILKSSEDFHEILFQLYKIANPLHKKTPQKPRQSLGTLQCRSISFATPNQGIWLTCKISRAIFLLWIKKGKYLLSIKN